MQITRDLLRKYTEGRCNPEEIRAIEEWMEDGQWPEWEEETPVPHLVRHSIWNKMQGRMEPVSEKRSGRPIPLWQRSVRVAAVVLLALLSGGLLIYYGRRGGFRKDEVVYITTKHNRERITLSDSSVVFLGPGSSVKLQQPFSGDRREIILNGEASFEVAKDPTRPFTVVTGAIHTTALGTSFKVTAYPDGDSVHVALSSGKVVVCNQSEKEVVDQLFLDPGEAVTYKGAGLHLQKTMTGARQYNYREDILYFKNAGVKEVMDKLEAFYHIQVRYDLLKDVHWEVSGEFDFQPLEIVLQNIAYTCDIRYTLKKDILILEPVRH
jgi:ferric-dicitrate binding protein FerR (iron transport regulator)